MTQQERWQLSDEAAEHYERHQVPALFAPLAELETSPELPLHMFAVVLGNRLRWRP